MRIPAHRWSTWMTAAVALVVLALTLAPVADANVESIPFTCILCGYRGTAGFLLNVALFLPLGAVSARAFHGGPGASRPRGRILRDAVLFCSLLSAGIEVAQLWMPQRHSALGDLLANAAGAGLGACLVVFAESWLRPSPRWAARLSLVSGAAVGILGLLTGWLLSPHLPPSAYWAQWTPDLGYLEHYQGRVLDARLGELSLPSGRLGDSGSERARRLLRSGGPLEVTAISGPKPAALAPIFSIYDGQRREIVLIGQDGPDLVLRVRRRADALGLDRPDLRLSGSMSEVPAGQRLWLWARSPVGDADRIPWRRVCLAHRGPGAANSERSCDLGYSVGRGWSLLRYPAGLSHRGLEVADAVWLGALFLPLGLWWRRRTGSAGGLILAAAGLAAAPLFFPLIQISWGELLGAILGLGAGRAVRRLSPGDGDGSEGGVAPPEAPHDSG